MIMDAQLVFSENQAITASANSTNVIDLSDVRDIGIGEELWLGVQVTETFADSGSDSTVALSLITDDNAAMSSPATVRSLNTLAALTPAGTIYWYRIPPETLVAYQQYIALAYAVAGGNLSAGKITAFLTRDPQKTKNYANGYSIS